jgi:hypothetical protein
MYYRYNQPKRFSIAGPNRNAVAVNSLEKASIEINNQSDLLLIYSLLEKNCIV